MGASKSLQGTFLNDEEGNPIAVILDGAVYRLQMQGKILNASGTQVNPATQDTLALIKAKTDNLDVALSTRAVTGLTDAELRAAAVPISAASLPLPAGAATQSTLASIDTVLTAIRDTAGVKKITDPLPAGTNNIGDVDVASSALPAGASTSALQSTLIGHVDTLETLLADVATETTLAAQLDITVSALRDAVVGTGPKTLTDLEAVLATIDAVLDSIKDTDGIKKITDPLPAGTNNIGDVDVLTNPQSEAAAKIVSAQFHQDAIASSTYYVLIDLDNGSGDYKHTGSSSIKIEGVSGSIVKSNIAAQWKSIVGIVLTIDGTSANIAWLDAAALFAFDTSKDEQHKFVGLPFAFDLAVSGGDLTKAAAGYIETGVTGVNTTTPLDNVKGTSTTPAVGDMILLVQLNSGGGTVEANYSARYYVE